MTLSVDWATKVVSSTSSIADIVAFKEELRVLEASATGILYDEVLTYSKLDLGGGAFFHAVDFINSYQMMFPTAGNYTIVGNINANIVPVAGVFVDRKTSASFATIGSGGSGGGGATPQQIWEYSTRTLTSGGGSGGGLTTEEHEHLMGLSQFSGGHIVDRTKNNQDLIDKIETLEKIIKKIPSFDIKELDKLLSDKIGNIKMTHISEMQKVLSNLLIEITEQKNILIDAKNKEKKELKEEIGKLDRERKTILDKFDNFNENLKGKDSLLAQKAYDIEEKSKKISELELQIKEIEIEKENQKQKAEETINELIEIHRSEIAEKEMNEGLIVNAYLNKN